MIFDTKKIRFAMQGICIFQILLAMYWFEAKIDVLVAIIWLIFYITQSMYFSEKLEILHNSANSKRIIFFLLLQIIVTAIAFFLYHSSVNFIPISELSNISFAQRREYLLNEKIDLNTRIIGYLSIVSTIIYIALRASKGSIYYLFFPITIGFLNTILTIGKGLALINLIVIFAFEVIKKKSFLEITLWFFLLLSFVFIFEFQRSGNISIESILVFFRYYFISPFFGFIDLVNNDLNYETYCIVPFLSQCDFPDSRVFSVPFGSTVTNVYGSLGYIYLTLGGLGVLVYLIFIVSYIKLCSLNFIHLRLQALALYNLILIGFFSFYVSPVTFNGFYFSLFILSFFDAIITNFRKKK